MMGLATSILVTAALATPASAADVTFGSTAATGGDCTFPCTAHLQQDYSAAAFGGPLTITRVSFFFDYYSNPSAAPWKVSLATNANGTGLGSTFASNLGADNAVFAYSPGSVTTPHQVDFFGSFSYDPGLGNLVVDILGPGGMNGSFTTTYDVSRVFSWGNTPTGYVNQGYGISTQFGTSVAAIPEPETYAMMLAGLGLLGLAARRRKQRTA
jgi:hypothetical protein